MSYMVFIGVTLWVLLSGRYLVAALRGQVRPNKVTWFLWSVAPMVATAAELQKGFSLAILPVFISGFIPLLIFLASFVNKNAYWKVGKFDIACAGISLATLVIWAVTKNPALAVGFSVLSDASAALPTVIKAYHYPQTENIWLYIGGIFSAASSFFAVSQWTFTVLAFPIYLLILNLTMTALIRLRK